MRASFARERAVKRVETISAIAGLVLLLIGILLIRHARLPMRSILVDVDGCHTPVTIIDPPNGLSAAGAAVFLHGLSANRRTMLYLASDFAGHGFRVYILDLPGHGDNRDEFTFARAGECAAITTESLAQAAAIDPPKTVLIGHSMGGDIAIRMADRIPVAATIAYSPGPMELRLPMPSNLLVFSAQYDPPPIRREARAIAATAGGNRTAPEDFSQDRAFELRDVPHAFHISWLFDRSSTRISEMWAMQALFPHASLETLALNLDLAKYGAAHLGTHRLTGCLIGVLGLALLFPMCVSAVAKAAGPALSGETDVAAAPPHPGATLALMEGAICSLAAVLVLAAFVPLKFLHLYSGEYLASLIVIAGILLLAFNWQTTKQNWSPRAASMFAASVLGFAIVLGFGAWLNWQITDVWMNAPRWWRFVVLLPFAWVFCLAEEVILGPLRVGKACVIRWAIFFGMRLELWLVCVLGYYFLGSGQALLGMLVFTLAAFSLLQRLATDALRARTGPTAASFFSAILAAWFIAAIFPLA